MRALEIAGYAGAFLVMSTLAFLFNDDRQGSTLPVSPPDPDEPPGPPRWRELPDRTLALVKGRRYRGCVSIPAPASWAISNAMVKARAEREGFTDVRVDDDRPSGWTDADCKWFVEATWAGDDELFARPSVITRAWWLA